MMPQQNPEILTTTQHIGTQLTDNTLCGCTVAQELETEKLFQVAVCGAFVTDIPSLPVNMQDILRESLIKVQFDSYLVVRSFTSFIFTMNKIINYIAFSFWHYEKHQEELRSLITIIEYIMRWSKFTSIIYKITDSGLSITKTNQFS